MTYSELEKLRDLAGKVMKGDMQTLIESLQYSPPVRPNPKAGPREPTVSPIITGLRTRIAGQQHRLTGGTTGEGQGGAGQMVGNPAGQAAGGT